MYAPADHKALEKRATGYGDLRNTWRLIHINRTYVLSIKKWSQGSVVVLTPCLTKETSGFNQQNMVVLSIAKGGFNQQKWGLANSTGDVNDKSGGWTGNHGDGSHWGCHLLCWPIESMESMNSWPPGLSWKYQHIPKIPIIKSWCSWIFHDFPHFHPFFNHLRYPPTLSPCSTWSCWRWTRTDAQKTWWPGWANARSATPRAKLDGGSYG